MSRYGESHAFYNHHCKSREFYNSSAEDLLYMYHSFAVSNFNRFYIKLRNFQKVRKFLKWPIRGQVNDAHDAEVFKQRRNITTSLLNHTVWGPMSGFNLPRYSNKSGNLDPAM